MGGRFDMGSTTLQTLLGDSSGQHQDLGALIRQLVMAVEPLEGKFNGAGKAAFDNFKAHSDEVAASLNNALASILGGQKGMDTAFVSGEQEHVDNARQQQGAANFDAARFSGRA